MAKSSCERFSSISSTYPLLDEIAAGEGVAPDRLLLDAIAHGLAMIAAGIDEDELHNATRDPPADREFTPPLPDPPRKRRRRNPRDEPGTWERGTGDRDDDIPF